MSFFSNLLVLECASVLAGPAVGAFFAELGATVIKLEPPGGDVTRGWKLACEDPGETVSAYFSCVNWGKHSLALDLRKDEGRELAQRLARKADIVLANYKPGAAERLGMDYASLKQGNEGLIYAHLTGYGHDDPRTGYDALLQAESGFLYLNAAPGSEPVKMPVALIDLLAGHQLKEAVLVALIERQLSGQGDYLEVSLLQSALASLANQAANWLVAGTEPRPMGLEHPNIAPYGGLYACADGERLMLAIGSDGQFASLVRILGAAELARDPRFARNADRVVNRVALDTAIRPLIAAWTSEELLQALWGADLPAGRVQTVSQALAHPAAEALKLQDPGGLAGLRSRVFQSRGTPYAPLKSPPRLGADAETVLQRWLGLEATACADLRRRGVLAGEST